MHKCHRRANKPPPCDDTCHPDAYTFIIRHSPLVCILIIFVLGFARWINDVHPRICTHTRTHTRLIVLICVTPSDGSGAWRIHRYANKWIVPTHTLRETLAQTVSLHANMCEYLSDNRALSVVHVNHVLHLICICYQREHLQDSSPFVSVDCTAHKP